MPDEEFDSLAAIRPIDLRTSVENLDVEQLTSEIFFVGGSDTEASINANGSDFPAIIINGDRYKQLNEFQDDNVNRNLPGGRLPRMRPPTLFHPFSPEDDRARIAVFLGRELGHLAAKGENDKIKIEVEELLEGAFDSWEQIDSDEKEKLIRKAEDILKLFEKKDVEGHMEKLDQRKYYVNSSQALERKFQEVANDLSNDDSSLTDWM
ncbi:hypothetical protein [Haloarchaeobius sp. HME9146]|uniref:hypothetical protein n=1 Tax=Haloarchaeobius sp. HME9146 TaxID=2978732 RepID=UPI0021BEA57E|nr:hypothetical protein [Haloarchaeobius sp. HME9146]MCT9096826.1 hypothetical protein [Haloarchaeobius sp. HME9146]